ncbi:MAG: small multi-drug export protein, partial [Oscillospiraceae bacterium]|nr:small multi-drug export protein [Oscillospiraceae bacterium]
MLWEIPFGKVLMTFFISMLPVLELRGAIPVALAHGMELWPAIAVSVVGNLVPVPFIIVFIRQIFAWLRQKSVWLNKVVTGLEQRAAQK